MRDKRLVAASFSRAATSYDQVANLQRRIADRLRRWLPDGAYATVLDLGCGTAYANPWLSPLADRLINLDLAEGMLRFSRERGAQGDFVGGDAESLPLRDESVDLIWSSLALQWSEAPGELMRELERVLRPNGRLMISTLGPKTLNELRTSWGSVDQHQHVNQFYSPTAWLEVDTSLALVRHQQVLETEYYQEVSHLLRELRALGAHNVNPERRKGLGGQSALRAMMQFYEGYRTPVGLPASYEVHYLEFIRR